MREHGKIPNTAAALEARAVTLVHAGTGCGSPNRNNPAGGLSLCA